MIHISLNMEPKILVFLMFFGILFVIPFVNAQEFEKATFQETFTVIYDQRLSNSIITSIGFETTDNKEIRFADELIQKINNNETIRAVVFTNSGECVIGVTAEEQCIMINFDYQQLKGDGGIRTVQESAKESGKSIINDLNEQFGTNAEFHSTFIHTSQETNTLLETSGVISGKGTVSSTFTMPKQSSDFLFLDLAGILIPKEIREAGGFYEIAKEVAKDENSILSVSIIPNENSNLYIFKVTKENKDTIEDISKINPLEHVELDQISRSEIFDGRNVPLNSVIHLVVIPSEQSKINAISTHAILDLTKLENILKKGWFFSEPAGDVIDLRFLFGESKTVSSDELRVEIEAWDGQSEIAFYSVEDIQKESEYESIDDFVKDDVSEEDNQSQFIILGIIIVVGIGAAIFYLKGYKPKH